MFSKYLKETRERAGLGVNELGRLANIDPSYISRLEYDVKRKPSPELLEKLYRHLKVPLNEMRVAAGYIEIPPDPRYKILKEISLTDEYIKKGLTEEQIKQVLDGVFVLLSGCKKNKIKC